MHELGIVFNIIKSVEDVAHQNKVKKVCVVTLEVGEVSTIVNSYLEDCWKWAVKKSDVLDECKLNIETIKAVSICEDCNKEYGTVENAKTCPYCGSTKTHLVRGQEVMIKDIETI